MNMPDNEALNLIYRALVDIRDDLRWFKQRELNKVAAVRQMASDAGLGNFLQQKDE